MTRYIGEILNCDRCGFQRVYSSVHPDLNRERGSWVSLTLEPIVRLRHGYAGGNTERDEAKTETTDAHHLCPGCVAAFTSWRDYYQGSRSAQRDLPIASVQSETGGHYGDEKGK